MKNYKRVSPDMIRRDGLEIIFLGRDPERDAYRIRVRKVQEDGSIQGITYIISEHDFWPVPEGAEYAERRMRGERNE